MSTGEGILAPPNIRQLLDEFEILDLLTEYGNDELERAYAVLDKVVLVAQDEQALTLTIKNFIDMMTQQVS